MVSIQVGATFAKGLFPEIGPLGTTTFRLGFASLILLAFWKPWKRKWKRGELTLIALYGASLGLMNLLFYCALERTPLGVVVALEFTGPLAIALFASHRKLDFLWAGLAAFGIYLILPLRSAAVEGVSLSGVLLALGAGSCWAFYILFGKRIGADVHSGQATAAGMTVAALTIVPFGAVLKGAQLIRPDLLPLGVGVAVLSSALPYSLEMLALKKLSHKTFSILMSVEPAMAALSGFLFLHEALSLKQWLAILLIMIASAGTCLADSPTRTQR